MGVKQKQQAGEPMDDNNSFAEATAAYYRLRQASSDLVDFMNDTCMCGLLNLKAEEATAHGLSDRLNHLLEVFKEPPSHSLALMVTEEERIIDRMHNESASYRKQITMLEDMLKNVCNRIISYDGGMVDEGELMALVDEIHDMKRYMRAELSTNS